MIMKLLPVVIVPITLSCVGCQSVGNAERVEKDFGNSVRQMVRAQIYDQDAAQFPHAEPPLMTDGEKAANSMNSYREDLGSAKSTEQPVLLQLKSGR